MATSDIDLLEIEVLWARFKERLSNDPAARWEDFAKEHPKQATRIHSMFPILHELDQLGADEDCDTPELIGRYPIVRRLGRGGMGEVFEAQCDALRERVAIKVISADRINAKNVKRFEQEARAVAALHHTNIVPIYEFGREGEKHFYTMRLIDGPNLGEIIKHTEPASASNGQQTENLPQSMRDQLSENWSLIAEMGAQAALALDHAHGKNVLHRDIKPANLLVDKSYKVWISDFGLAKTTSVNDELTSIFQTVGTPRYMAPEQAKGIVDQRSDVYSLGVTLLELATMQVENQTKLLAAFEDLPSPRTIAPTVPADLDAIIVRATQRVPSQRFQSASQLAEALQHCAANHKISKKNLGYSWLLGCVFATILVSSLATALLLTSKETAKPAAENIQVDEGSVTVKRLSDDLGDLTTWELAGTDRHAFRIDQESRELQFWQPTDHEVPSDRDMDNKYFITLQNTSQEQSQVSYCVEVLDRNEPPALDEFVFQPDGKTIRLAGSQLSEAWSLDVTDDHDDPFSGLFFSIAGGVDSEFIKLTPQGVFVFDRRLSQTGKWDSNRDGIYEIDVAVSDATQVWIDRLEQRAGGSIALVREKVSTGAKLESRDIAAECLIRRDVIDFASADGANYFHIHPNEGKIALYASKLRQDGTFETQLLSKDCGLPTEVVGLATRNGTQFTAVLRQRGRPGTAMQSLELEASGEFKVLSEQRDCGLPAKLEGLGWLDSNRFHHIRRLPSGDALLFFSFLEKRFSNMRLSNTESQYKATCRGQAVWIGRAAGNQQITRQVRFDTN